MYVQSELGNRSLCTELLSLEIAFEWLAKLAYFQYLNQNRSNEEKQHTIDFLTITILMLKQN